MLDDGRHRELNTGEIKISHDANSSSQAVRLGYLLGLEQLVMQPDDIEEKNFEDRARGKIVWSCELPLPSRLIECIVN